MFGENIIWLDSKKVDWEDPPRGYYLTDVKQKVLWTDEKTGAMMTLIKFPVGVADQIHSHPEANQFCYGISGEFEGQDGNKHPVNGIFLLFPKGEKHGSTNFTMESIILFYWDGSPTPEV